MITNIQLHLPADKTTRLAYIKQHFSDAKGPNLTPAFSGGRSEALLKLASIDGILYQKNRNFLNGAVTHLSPYLRHGCITLKETFEFVNERFGTQAEKLMFELAWRDYWRQVWYLKGDAILSEIEAPKVALGYAAIPIKIKEARTNLPCMDAFIRTLLNTGYMHNHARMWFASYVVHHLKVSWRVAADWFQQQLLDGDFASNHLSWQWVASTFGAKPYFFNRENLSRFTQNQYCETCHVRCPFDASYETLAERIFDSPQTLFVKEFIVALPKTQKQSNAPTKIIFIHDEMLSSEHALLQEALPKLFIFDPNIYQDWSLKRLQFIAYCLIEMEGIEVWLGNTQEILAKKAIGRVISQKTPNQAINHLLQSFDVTWLEEPSFSNLSFNENDLKRFSKYWQKVGVALLGDKDYRKP